MSDSSREAILRTIGAFGRWQQDSFFEYMEREEAEKKRPCPPLRERAESYARYRREYIEAARRGEFARYGITEADIVE